MSILSAALRQKGGPNWQPYTRTILSPSSIVVFTLCLLGLLALVLVIVGLAGIALGPLLLVMGWSLLKFVGGMLLLLFLFRVTFRLIETLLRAVRKSPLFQDFARQARPWIIFAMACVHLAARAFWRWYQDQQRGA